MDWDFIVHTNSIVSFWESDRVSQVPKATMRKIARN